MVRSCRRGEPRDSVGGMVVLAVLLLLLHLRGPSVASKVEQYKINTNVLRSPGGKVERLGTADFALVETTPVVWKGKLLRFESVRSNYGGMKNCSDCALGRRDPAMGNKPYFRFRDVASPLAVTPSFAAGFAFGSAFVQPASARSDAQGDTMWAFGRPGFFGPSSNKIVAFSSTDLITWKQGPGVELDGFGHTAKDYKVFNNNVHIGRGGDQAYIMAIETSGPLDVTNCACFTTVFATHAGGDDLSTGWTFLDPHAHIWPPPTPKHGYKGACPTIRYVPADDYYYVLTLWSQKPVGYSTFISRSKNLSTWEECDTPVLGYIGEEEADKGRTPRTSSWNYYTNFTAEMEAYIAQGEDINDSDIDFVDVNGSVYITYSWGNQQTAEFLGAAQVTETTTDKWLQSYFQ
jgi:hypothetical protein